MPISRILLVLDNPPLAEELQHHLKSRDYAVEWVANDEQGVNGLISGQFQSVIATLSGSRIDGMRLLSVARDRDASMPVVLLAEAVPSDAAMAAYDAGATAVLGAPHSPELIERHLDQGWAQQRLQHEVIQLKRQLDTRHALSNLVGSSQRIASIHDQVRQLAPSATPIILSGECGTGRDHLARIIHTQSPRTHRSFVKFSFDSEAHASIERLLFGFGPKVYPDAPQGSVGHMETADGGTLYLDNLSGLNAIQADELLASLEKNRVHRLGESRSIPIDIRLIVSVTQPLRNDTMASLLDRLCQRLGAHTLELPSLRERTGDIPALAQHFVRSHSTARKLNPPAVSPDALDALTRYPWPGNVRELETVIEGVLANLGEASMIEHRHLPEALRHHAAVEPTSVHVPVGTTMSDVERLMIEATMRANDQDKDATAEQLGIGLRTLYRKLKEYKSGM